jgi:DNA repair protein SbcD/Mre11
VFEGFDYVALGHLHGPQRAGENGRYCGSPLKYSFDEAGQRKSFTILDIHKNHIERNEFSGTPLRDMRVISGLFADLLQQGREHPSNDYLYANLKDNAPVYMPMDQLRPYYPNLLGLSSAWLSSGGDGVRDGLRDQFMHRKTDDIYVFEQFIRQICGGEVDDDDRELFLQALNTCREENEQ